ncbi:MAG: aminoglycoside adenylyltransferase domain-containing protein [Chloroflexia bacterium]
MPASDPTAYPDVNAVLHELLVSVQAILGPHFLGMYLYGSLALGDFTPHRSDIDFAVVTDTELPDELVAALYAMHERLSATISPWGAELEGSYIPQAALRRYDRTQARYPSIKRGERLRVDSHDSAAVIQLHLLREHGIALAGPVIHEWIDPVAPDDLRRAVVEMVGGWLVPKRGDSVVLRHEGYRGYIVLTICRMLYTLEFGTIVSKPEAARWAQGALGERWAPLIERAVAEDVDETLELIEYTLDRVQTYEMPGDDSA